jgi:hypothetical protein
VRSESPDPPEAPMNTGWRRVRHTGDGHMETDAGRSGAGRLLNSMIILRRMRRGTAASGCLRTPYLGAVGAGDVGGGAAPVVPDGVMISATRLSFGSINKTSLLSSLAYSRPLAAGTRSVTLGGS